jgi:hypothetical protein
MARLALLTFILQLSSLGHWQVGPFHPGMSADPEQHAAHCHGDTSACGGQPSFVGTYVEKPIAVVLPSATIPLPADSAPSPEGAILPIPERPPRDA